MAFEAVAGTGGAYAQRLWDDPAFLLYREAAEAMDRREHDRAAALARSAIGHYPDFALAHFLLGQAELAAGRPGAARAAFRTVVDLYPGSLAAQRALRRLTPRPDLDAEVALELDPS